MINYQNPDLTQHPPRSPHARLGGYVHLPRLLDKARAHAAGKIGAYQFNCPLDQTFFEFTGIVPAELLVAVQEGRSDTEMLAWVGAHTTRAPFEIAAWSELRATLGPGAAGAHAWFAETISAGGKDRDDLRTYFDLLEFDDYVSFGGRA
ncbi:MAG TPA: DUF5069 domain-containing protein [Lacunisphaera sp.]|nr:DUF5069 domain-containing protein [Lacunisphaera sp.]